MYFLLWQQMQLNAFRLENKREMKSDEGGDTSKAPFFENEEEGLRR